MTIVQAVKDRGRFLRHKTTNRIYPYHELLARHKDIEEWTPPADWKFGGVAAASTETDETDETDEAPKVEAPVDVDQTLTDALDHVTASEEAAKITSARDTPAVATFRRTGRGRPMIGAKVEAMAAEVGLKL